MSARPDAAPDSAPGADGPRVVAAAEVVVGRVVLVNHHLPPECDPFVNRRFDLTETADALELTTEVRVHEQLRVERTRVLRSRVVAATLRREAAELDGEPVAPP